MGLRIAYSSIFLAVETFPVNVCCFVCFCSTLVLFQPLLMFCLQVPGFGLLDRISIALLLIPTTTTTTLLLLFLISLPSWLTAWVGQAARIFVGELRGNKEGCVSESGLLTLGLHVLACGRLASGPYFEILEGPRREGDRLRNQWGFWWWIYPLPPSFLDSYSPTFSKALRGQECPSSAYWGIVFSDGQQSVLLGVVPKSQLWTLFWTVIITPPHTPASDCSTIWQKFLILVSASISVN